ncbi:hypothetical protein SASPL_148010 [Salvia splendens]|uniref:F-box domain-containing protein n=1 Tax=Salvia splendens TaxID=180675 RepID=A0A8X8W8J1_SALSN|nr:hypothetical protein SASPL_148010 [Salvia splendens]
MKKSATGEKTSLLKWAEERMKLKPELEEEKRKQQTSKEPRDSSLVAVPYLPDDCIFHIIVRLPLESLLSSRFVCKAWYRIVNRPDFVDSPSSAIKRWIDIFDPGCEDSVAVLHWHLFSPRTRFQIKYLEIGGDKSTIKEYNVTCTGHIKATCNGLIILEKVVKGRGLIVMNPVTREVEEVPLGTMCDPHRESSRYKLVHLFQDASQCIGCEIMHIRSRTWRVVEGPPHGFMGWLGYPPVSATGALPNVDHNEHIVSMPLKDEKFVKIPLPSTGGIHDRVLEIGGSLGFVSPQPGCYFPHVNSLVSWKILQDENKIGVTNS